MTKNRIVKYATNTALLAVLAAAGIGAYQLGTSKPEENIQEEQEFVEMEQSTEEEPMVDVGTTEVEADMENTSGDLAGTEMEDGANGNEEEYKLSPAIAVQAAEGAPVLASVPGTVYSIEENAQTGTTVTMEIGSGYQAVYGQLKDLAVEEGATVDKGTVIGYIAAPTKYYSEEGSNLYFAMKKDGEPVDPIAYLPE